MHSTYYSYLELTTLDLRGTKQGTKGHITAQRECRSGLINRVELGIESDSLRGAGDEPPKEPESRAASVRVV